jgi:hypothetical protein
MYVFVLAGQSNLSGRGAISEILDLYKSRSDVLRFNEFCQWEVAEEPLHRGIDPKKERNGAGPGIPFAIHLLERLPAGSTVGLVPCAVGGSELKQWHPEHGELYKNMIERTKRALESDDAVLAGLIWYQGESEAMMEDPEDSSSYGLKFEQLLTSVRADLSAPDLPTVFVIISSRSTKLVNLELMRKVQGDIQLPSLCNVDSEPSTMGIADEEAFKDAGLHLNTVAATLLGKKIASAYCANFSQTIESTKTA